MRRPASSRLVRGGIAASFATFVALLAHVAGGGTVSGWQGLVVPWALSLIVCLGIAGARLPIVRLSVSVIVSQVLFHTLFGLGAASSSVVPPAGLHEGHSVMSEAASMPPLDAVAVMTHAGPMMWCWHAVAALITIVALHRGEQAIRRMREVAGRIAAWVRRRARSTVPLLGSLVSARTSPIAFGPRSAEPAAPFLLVASRRGPPATCLI